ncbi:DUF6779 domain-containing protein [Mycolicibacter sp. MYC123]|uniref:DUF6779 domain-containing protein n=1 Tax=[Mycobacterium] zoologicum TaxID=2872311 RepID=A0ABU5YET3_9MYCO|nr:DUF6779 domain-containing protein [Mycolicibacter sp. MYC123]MEB3048386.1 DUF6779 domain-containing protein [Mycolicibacter sp. MYC123]
MNSVLSRAPGRRGGRRPGWTLLTALLILAIAASSALVFTSRVELLKLAVIVALWAAVASAFVSVIYRRQSDVDQARARDLKLVYDLQLDREISARREYELTVESQLRRELASELRAQAADEVAALRTELSALRTNLEILFDADLSHRPALETESSGRTTIRAYSDWARTGSEAVTGARPAPATASFYPEDAVTKTSEHPIIDVPEVRIPTGAIPMPSTPQPHQPHQPPQQPPTPRGAHHRAADEPQMPSQKPPHPQQPQPNAGRWAQPAQPFVAPEQHREPEPPPPPPQQPPPPQPWAAPAAPVPTPTAAPAPKSEPSWKPVGAEGEWLPPGTPGSNWSSATPVESSRHGDSGRHGAKEPDAETPSRHGRHSGPSAAEGTGGRRRAESRHSAESVESPGSHAAPEPTPAPVAEPAPEPVPAPRLASPPPASARHSTGAEAVTDGEPSTGGQSVAELLARLQTVPGEGRRRRRRED